ncbi:MAG: single-stranded-DNA-specific exonuclease RecJ [Clostridiales bacterium]|nr:single-stranded-DNA-specific exonuclease RecJ [Clostridiales bacterium]
MEFKKLNENLIDKGILENFSKSFSINKKIIEILYARGYNSKEKISSFLYDDITNLKNPFLLNNMNKVVERINLAIKNNEKILIFGDYDVDGVCAVSILHNYLIEKTKNIKTYLPNRFEDGYGLSCPCIDKIAQKEKPDLIITVDCGISCEKEVEYIKQMGIDIIVTDHHELPENLPNCLIVNPKFDQEYNFKGLCGAGVSFKIVEALSNLNNENYEKYLPICAIATIADIVPLIDDNRIIVKEGLKRLDLLPNGVKQLLKMTFSNLNNITSIDIAYKLAPKINSAGRLDDATIALNLFINSDEKLIENCIKQLEILNEKRKEICDNIFEESKLMIKNLSKDKAIILYNKSWDIGVLGIVAARLAEEYNKPVILFGYALGELKGSGRSIGNIDIFKLFNSCSDFLSNFGGHTKAGGLSLKLENFNAFKESANAFLNKNYIKEDYKLVKYYDLELKEEDINLNFINSLNILQPFGFENSLPVFLLKANNCSVSKLKKFPNHLTITLNKINLMSFNDEINFENYFNFNDKEFLIELQINEFKGKKECKGIVRNVKFNNIKENVDFKLEESFINQLIYTKEEKVNIKRFNSVKQLNNIINDKTLIITYSRNNDINGDFAQTSLKLNKNCSQSTLIYGINSLDNIDKFDKIILLQKPINNAFVTALKNQSHAEIYLPKEEKEIFDYKIDREELLEAYFAMKKAGVCVCFENFYQHYKYLLNKINYKLSFIKHYLAITIFRELNLFKPYGFKTNPLSLELGTYKVDLNNSKIFKKVKK